MPPEAPGVPEYMPTQGAPVPPPPTYQYAPQPQYAQVPPAAKTRTIGLGSAKKEKWPAVALAFVLGTFGIHKFYLGYKTEGLIMLLTAIIGSCVVGLGPVVMLVISLIEAVKYVTLTEEDFEETYVRGYKGWL